MAKFEFLLLAMLAVTAIAYPSDGYGAARVIRAADPDPHRHYGHESYRTDYYDSGRRYGGYDGYNGDRYYNQQPYQTRPYYGNQGAQSQASAAAGSYGGLSFAAANSQAGSGNF